MIHDPRPASKERVRQMELAQDEVRHQREKWGLETVSEMERSLRVEREIEREGSGYFRSSHQPTSNRKRSSVSPPQYQNEARFTRSRPPQVPFDHHSGTTPDFVTRGTVMPQPLMHPHSYDHQKQHLRENPSALLYGNHSIQPHLEPRRMSPAERRRED